MLERVGQALHLLYPPQCIACGDLVSSDFGLCAACLQDAPFVLDPVCDRCGTPLIGPAVAGDTCDGCLIHPPVWSRGRAAMRYDGQARSLVLALKHGDRTDLARPLGAWLARAALTLRKPDSVVVPVPLHRWRLFRRRYNQAALLGEALARAWDVPVLPDALIRPQRTASQDHKGREARFANLAGAIAPHPTRGADMRDRSVLLVDDVMASGATLNVAAKACLAAGARRVDVAVVARVAALDRA